MPHGADNTIRFDNAASLRFSFFHDGTVDITVSSTSHAGPWCFAADSLDELIDALEMIQAKLREEEQPEDDQPEDA